MVSLTTAIRGQPKGDYIARRRRAQTLKVGTACLSVLLLMYVGFKGKHHAGLQAKLKEIVLLRDQLQQRLDEQQRSPAQLLAGGRGANANPGWPPASDPQVIAVVNALKTRLSQFDSDQSSAGLSDDERLELRLSEAILANAEGRLTDALAMITDKDEKSSNLEPQIGRSVRVLQTRADSFYGLHQWQEALDRYRRVLTLQPNRIVAIARIADCQSALGQTNDALSTLAELAKTHNNRGNALRLQGKPDAAIVHYGKAIDIQTWLVEQQGRTELARDLAKSYRDRGDTFTIQRNADAANADFSKAKEYELRSP